MRGVIPRRDLTITTTMTIRYHPLPAIPVADPARCSEFGPLWPSGNPGRGRAT